MALRFAHVNLIARDWQALARFYERVFGCVRRPPERDHVGGWIGKVTGVPGARIRGVHLALPGFDAEEGKGPTLEIFTYDVNVEGPQAALNRVGFGHLAFEVDDVEEALFRLLAAGGTRIGDVATRHVPGAGTLTLVYARDPEGNAVELQRWERDSAG